MDIFLGEFVGTFLMILLGNGVVANVLLNKSKGIHGGWIVVSFGWGFAVAVSVYLAGYLSGAHLNPAVTFAFVLSGATSLKLLPIYWVGQFLGAILGGIFVWLNYYSQFKATEDSHFKLLCFSTVPAVRAYKWNFITEVIATAVLILGIFGILASHNDLASGIAPYLIGVLVTSVGLSLGGPTGYAINPARDIGPRIAYSIIFGKATADWRYAWIPGLAPLLGSFIGYSIYSLLF
jgi:glycerol uptake facilitator protein